MSDANNTPGPWMVDYAQGIIGPDGDTIAYILADSSEVPHPNARLIAAAPDLLAALSECEGDLACYESEAAKFPAKMQTLARVRSAIAKAEGRA